MSSYFFWYAGAGCLGTIALSSLATEISRLVPSLWQILIIVWAVCALASLAWLRFSDRDEDLSIWFVVNFLVGLGVIFGAN